MNPRCFAIVAALLLARSAVGQEGPPLEDFISSALRTNPTRSLSRASVLTAESDRLRAGASLLPTLHAQGTYTRNQHESVVTFPDGSGGTSQIVISPFNALAAQLVGQVPLVDPPGFMRWRAAIKAADAAQDDDEANANDVALAVAREYYTTVAAAQLMRATARNKGAADENLRIARVRLKEGAATALIADRAEVEVSRAELQVIDATRLWNSARHTLSSSSGLPEPAALWAPPPSMEPTPAEAELLTVATANRKELAAAKLRVQEAELGHTAAWTAYAPSLNAVGTQRWTNAAGFTGFANYWAAGVTADWQLLDFGTRSAELKRERAQILRNTATLDRARIAVGDEVHTAWLDTEAARAKLGTARRGEELALRAADEMRVRFKAGTATQLDIIQTDRDALQAEVDRIRAEGELSIARLALRRAVGQPVVAAK